MGKTNYVYGFVTSPKEKIKNFEEIKTGLSVSIVAEDNPFDHYAMAVYNACGEKLGYICNSSKTISKFKSEVKSASHMRRLIDYCEDSGHEIESVSAVLSSEIEYSEDQKLFELSVTFSEKEKAEALLMIAGGSTTLCKDRSEVVSRISDAISEGREVNVPVTIYLENSEIQVKLDDSDAVAGQITLDENMSESVDKLKSFLEKHQSVKGYAVSAQKLSKGRSIGYAVSVSLEASGAGEYMGLIRQAEKKGCGTRLLLKEKLSYLKNLKISDKVITKVFENMRPLKPGVPSKPRNLYRESYTHYMEDAIACTLCHKNLCLFGPASAGKDVLLDSLHWLLNIEQVRVEGSVDTDREELLGGLRIKDGETKFVLSEAMKGLIEGKCVIIDEANTIYSNVLIKLHSLMDTSRYMFIEDYGKVEISKDAMFAFTMNEGYIGTSEMNPATISRTMCIEMQPQLSLKEIFKDENFPENKLEYCQRIWDIVRDNENGEFTDVVITPRGFHGALEVSAMLPLQRSLRAGIAGQIQNPQQRASVAALIDSIVPASA